MSTTPSQKHPVHVLPLSVYIGVGSALFVLTGITVAVAQVNLGGMGNLIVAMVVATIKGSLVALFFMHLLYDNKFYAFVFSISLMMLGIFIAFTMFDTLRRDGIYEERSGQIRDEAKMYQKLRESPRDVGEGHGAAAHSPAGH